MPCSKWLDRLAILLLGVGMVSQTAVSQRWVPEACGAVAVVIVVVQASIVASRWLNEPGVD